MPALSHRRSKIDLRMEACIAKVLALMTAHARADSAVERVDLAEQIADELLQMVHSPQLSTRFIDIAERLGKHWREIAWDSTPAAAPGGQDEPGRPDS